MNELWPFGSAGDVLADDLLLDRIAGRADAGGEPVAGLLAALAAHADSPLPARTGRRRIVNKHRYLGAFAALAVAASGAGVAAAVTLPDGGPLLASRARIEQRMEQNARSGAPSGLLSRLGLPATDGTTAARGLVLARGADGTFVLLPSAVAAPQAGTPAADQVPGAALAAGASTGVGNGGTLGGGFGQGGGRAAESSAPAAGKDKAPKDKTAKPARARPGTAAGAGKAAGAGNAVAGNAAGNGQGVNDQGGDSVGQAGSRPIWVVAPSTGTTGTRGSTPTDPTVTGVGPSVLPGAVRPASPRAAAPRSANASEAAASAVAAARAAAAAAAARPAVPAL